MNSPCLAAAAQPPVLVSSECTLARWVALLAACLALLGPQSAMASEPVYVAGFAYLGDLQYIDTNYAEARRL
ncbi:MAG: hypothetical protein AAGF46_09445, partial [Pseudomonadota bacterium]